MQVCLLSFAMFLSTFVLGLAPLKLNLQPKMLKMCSLVGAGLLVGAALIIIMPEGVIVLISALSKRENQPESNSDEINPELFSEN